VGNYNFQDDICLDSAFREVSGIQVGARMKFFEFDKDVKGVRSFILNYNNSNGDMLYMDFLIKENKLLDDIGIVLSDTQETIYPTLKSKFVNVIDRFNYGTFGRLYINFFEDSPYYVVKERKYLKITDTALIITTIISTLRAVCDLLLIFIVEYYFLKFITIFIDTKEKELVEIEIRENTDQINFVKYLKKQKSKSCKRKENQINFVNFLIFRFLPFIKSKNLEQFEELVKFASLEELYSNTLKNKINLRPVLLRNSTRIPTFNNSKPFKLDSRLSNDVRDA
jgi:hypothetical protein